MAEAGQRGLLDVVGDEEVAALLCGAGFGDDEEVGGGAGAGAESDGGPLASAADDGEEVVKEGGLDANRAEFAAGGDEIERGDGGDFERFELRRVAFGMMTLEDGAFVRAAGIIDANFNEEAVELGFGEGVGALKLERILGGEDGEEVVEGVSFTVDGDLALFHAFEKRGLGARAACG